MLDLVYSSHTEKLLDALIADVAEQRRELGPLEPVRIVVPNRNIETYLRFGIARRTGIAANLEVHLLRRFVGKLLCAGPEPLQILDADALRDLVLEQLLDDAALREPELAPVRGYLHAAGDSAEAIDVRRVQLADALARLFEEYGFSREELLREWPRRHVLGGTPLAETEVWQRALWLRIFGSSGSAKARTARDGIARLQLGALLDSAKPADLNLPGRLHVFGVSYVARAFQRIFAMLAERTHLSVYTLNPCREFWEDVPGGRRAPGPLDREENLALRLWGTPGRENIRLLNELCGCDFREAFPERLPDTLLGRLQGEILDRAAPDLEKPPRPADASIRVFACPSIRREAEAIAEEVWALVDQNPDLRFNEIAVVVAGRERETYFTQLAAAFRACHEIPHNVVDLDLSRTSRIAEAVQLLLALPLGRFTRPELLTLLTHPASLARFPGVDASEWVSWCERLEILHGADHADHAASYIERDVFNWDQGLRRLALGAFMASERSGEERDLAVGAERYQPEELDRQSQPAAAQLAMAVRSLVADARFAQQAKLGMADWTELFASLIEAHLAPSGPQEERELSQCLGAIRGLGECDLGDREVGFRVAHELARGALSGLGGSRGQHLADGVAIASSQPMRALPFKAIFVAGLGEGQFPAADRRDPLDLRAADPRRGDVSPRARDRYLFLETLLCARERLYLSYVARDVVSGEPLQPSSAVQELLQMLEASQLGPGGRSQLIREVRLRRHEPALEQGQPLDEARITFPEARRERAVVRLREDLLAAAGRLPELSELRASLAPELYGKLAEQLALCAAPVAAVRASERVRVSLSALRKFLECPLQGHAQYRLGLVQDEEGESAEERADEHFSSEGRFATALLQDVFVRALATDGPPLETLYRERFEHLARAGQVPVGIFGEVEQRRHLEVLQAWHEQLQQSPQRESAVRVHRFGPAQEHERVDAVHPPLGLTVELASGPIEVELTGRVRVAEGPWASLVMRTGEAKPDDLRRLAIPAYLDQLALAAAGLHEEAHRAQVLVAEGSGPGPLNFAPVSVNQARSELAALTADLLSGAHDYLLPCEAVFAAQKSGESISRQVEKLLENDRARCSSRYGPIRNLERYPPLPDDQANELVARRFGPFFARASEEPS